MAHGDTGATEPEVRCTVEGPIGWLRISNPQRMNAMSLAMWGALAESAARLGRDPSVRVVVVAGADHRNFCVGADISEFSELRADPSSMAHYDRIGKSATDALENLEKPVIAMIEGYCLGGGMGMAASCDVRIAADNAKLGISAARLGVSYDYGGLKRLVGLVGPSAAKRIMFTARKFDAAEALNMGLVDEVVPAAQLQAHVEALARTIAENAPLSIAASKFIIDMVSRGDADEAACKTKEIECLESADYAEATRAFMEKRPAVFIGR